MSVTIKLSHSPIAKMLKARGLNKGGRAQIVLANEIRKRNDKYVPLRRGPLKNTAYVTPDGSKVIYPQTYAERQYKETPDTRAYDPIRGAHWHYRMMGRERKDIVNAVAKEIGGKPG